MTDDALLLVLRQIRDELREMNGKDADGTRVKQPASPWKPFTPPLPPVNPYPYAPYIPYWNINQVTADSNSYLVNDHQGERVANPEDT